MFIRIDSFPSATEDIANMWDYCFPNLSVNDINSFLVLISAVWSSMGTVARVIDESEDMEEISMWQDSLDVIFEAIRYIAHYRMMDSLKLSMKLLELQERGVRKGTKRLAYEIKQTLDAAKDWAKEITQSEIEHVKIFAHIEGDEVEAFRKAYGKLVTWAQNHPGKELFEWKGYRSFQTLFYKIPLEKLIQKSWWRHSKEYVGYLCEWLSFEATCNELRQKLYYPEEAEV